MNRQSYFIKFSFLRIRMETYEQKSITMLIEVVAQ